LNVNGSFSYGTVTPYIETDADAQLFNIGNLPLTLSPLTGDLITGSNAADFLLATAGDSPACTSATPVAAAMSCYFGFGVVPSLASGTETASVAILSNASNAPSISLALSANPVVDSRPATTTTISPIAALTYPGKVTITVAVASAAGTPQGTVLLKVTGHGAQTAQLASGVIQLLGPFGRNLQGQRHLRGVRHTGGRSGLCGERRPASHLHRKTGYPIRNADNAGHLPALWRQ
jgi:hypothetical protein